MTHINVIILTPGHSMMKQYVESLLALTDRLNKENITWAWSAQYASHVADAREVTLNGGLGNSFTEQRPFRGEVTYDKLLWIDSDIAFTPEDAMKLLNSDKDIISGAYLLANGEAVVYPEILYPGIPYEELKKLTEPMKVAGIGFGFVAIKQGIFEKLSRPWFQSAMFTTKDGITFPLMGEDLSWCKRVTDLGYEIWLDPSVRLTHHKTMRLTWEGILP